MLIHQISWVNKLVIKQMQLMHQIFVGGAGYEATAFIQISLSS
jgi:hypothetical protein